jgi:hypothetical protein
MRRFYKYTLCILEQLSTHKSALAPRAAKDGVKNYPSDGDRITAVCTEEAGKEAARFIKVL